ncbi:MULTISPECIES: polysaccharide lyase 8 family protein [unclassified Streptomyces]|uniref:polysaccharide lyase 8 family protein n=1 Tax=unclassified Streptomyces TaxID=2593676 RepID=UPI00225BD681|nr:polysaccharide lyase 8 family protein [Streptomyces sp. NBC_00047]MCX5610681.1 polysaccharide lyase 8 family protein [Streptomyces sp. NBC_00047]
MSSPWSRRSFLHLSGNAALLAGMSSVGALAPTGTASAAGDEYDTLRLRWRGMVLGSGFDPAAEPFAGKLALLGTQAAEHRSTMAAVSGSLWPDLPLTISSSITGSYARLATMAQAYAQPGTGLTGGAALAAEIKTGLDHLYQQVYNPAKSQFGNWWDFQIGSPQILLDISVILHDQLSAAQLANHLAAVDRFVPDSSVAQYTGTSTGANRVDLCRSLALRGILGKNAAKVALARDALSPVFPLVTSGDGFYPDGSFVQHTYLSYTGSYGAVLLGGLAGLFSLLSGSTWAVTEPKRQLVLDSVEKSYAPFLYNGLMMDAVSGRATSRGNPRITSYGFQGGDHGRGHGVLASIALLGGAASSAENQRWRGLVKGWMQRDYYSPVLADTDLSVAALARLKAVQDDNAVTALGEPTGHRLFPSMDRAVHRRPGWAASISMASKRMGFYETGNGENLRGWHAGAGMLQWWGDTYANGQYTDAFWPTVDPYRLPGITVSRKVLADAEGGAWGLPRPDVNWVGGATDGEYAAIGQFVRGLAGTLYAKKSWFCLADSVVCLAGAVRSADGTTVETVVDNRNLGATGTQGLTVNGAAQSTALGWSASLTGAGWAQIAGHGGYVFPGGATVKARREARTGSWHDINTGGTTDPITRRYLTLWFDHGVDPVDAACSYILMPGAGTAATAARAADTGWLTVLANDNDQQGVRVASLGVTAVNFWFAGTVGTLSADKPACVLVREHGDGTATLCVSDPMRMQTGLTVTWNRPVASVLSKPATVASATTGSALTLTFTDLTGQAGATQTITVRLG